MIHHRKTILAVGVAAATTIAGAMLVVPAIATPALGGFSPNPLALGTFADLNVKAERDGKWDLMLKAKGLTDVRVTEVNFPAGSSSGWHSHPGPNLLIVISGEVVEYEGDDPLCTGNTLTAQAGAAVPTGETFGDNGGSHVHLVRNESAAPAKVMAIAFYPNGVTPLTDSTKPKPNNCPADVL